MGRRYSIKLFNSHSKGRGIQVGWVGMAATYLPHLHLASPSSLPTLSSDIPHLQTKRETGEKSINDISEGRKQEEKKEGRKEGAILPRDIRTAVAQAGNGGRAREQDRFRAGHLLYFVIVHNSSDFNVLNLAKPLKQVGLPILLRYCMRRASAPRTRMGSSLVRARRRERQE